MEDLVTGKINIYNANADQISFIINLTRRYEKNDFFDEEAQKTKNIFWKDKVLNEAKKNSLQLRKKSKKWYKDFKDQKLFY